jgi:hypothetical protein
VESQPFPIIFSFKLQKTSASRQNHLEVFMAVNLPPTFVYKALWGSRIYQPQVAEPHSCGMTQSPHRSITDFQPSDPIVQMDQEELILRMVVDRSSMNRLRDLDKSDVYGEDLEIFPYSNAPQSCKLYEQGLGEQKWERRIQLFGVAFQTQNIFTISIIPKNPTTCQTWYQKRLPKPSDPDYLPITRTFENKTWGSNLPATEEKAPEKQLGFLKPFPTFSNEVCAADPIFEKIEAEWLCSREDIPGAVEDISGPLKNRFMTILTLFLKDEEAVSLGMTFFQEGKGCVKLFHKA